MVPSVPTPHVIHEIFMYIPFYMIIGDVYGNGMYMGHMGPIRPKKEEEESVKRQ